MPIKKTVVDKNFGNKSCIIYGDPKVGKSTFCAGLSEKIGGVFFATEAGHKFLEVNAYVKPDGSMPSEWQDFLNCLNEFARDKDHQFLVVDTVGHLIKWCVTHVLKRHGASDESEGRFGNIFREISREFERVINKLGQLNKGIIFIAHLSPVKEKEGLIYPDLPDKYENLFNGMVDYIFYFYADEKGNRMIRTKGNGRIMAGDRSGRLPEVMPMDIDVFLSNFK